MSEIDSNIVPKESNYSSSESDYNSDEYSYPSTHNEEELTWQDHRHIKCKNNPFCDFGVSGRHNYIQCRRKKRRHDEIRDKEEDEVMNELIQSLGDKAENHSIGELEYPSDTEDEDYEDMDWDYDIPRDDGDRVYMKSDDCICYLNKNKYPSIKLKCCGKVMHLVCMLTYYYSDCPTKYLCPFCRNDWSNSTYNGEFVIVQLDNEGNLIYPANPPGNSWGDIPDEEWVVGGTL